MPLIPSEGSIAKNALLSRVSELGIGEGKARGFLAGLIDRGMLFEWHVPRPRTNPEVRIARYEQPRLRDLYAHPSRPFQDHSRGSRTLAAK
jgi:hypothetical protein